MAIKKTKNPEYIVALLNPYLPDIVSTLEFFEILTRYDIDLLNQIKHKGDFLELFIAERVKKLFNGTLSCLEFVEFDLSH